MTHRVSLLEFLLSCLVMLAIVFIAFTVASNAWIEHYR